MITLLGWLAALVALVTAIAMLGDSYIKRRVQWQLAVAVLRGFNRWRHGTLHGEDRRKFRRALRVVLGHAVLVFTAATSAVLVLMPQTAGLTAGPYEVGLRWMLVCRLAMMTPCPWHRFVLTGRKRGASEGSHVH